MNQSLKQFLFNFQQGIECMMIRIVNSRLALTNMGARDQHYKGSKFHIN